jgi:acyl-CoA dehydrogenase
MTVRGRPGGVFGPDDTGATMDFTLDTEQKAIRDTVRMFVEREVMPLESELIRREIRGTHGSSPGLTPEELHRLQEKGRTLGLWGVDTPEAYGGSDLDPVALAIIHEQLGRTFVDFEFGGSAVAALYGCNASQRERYLLPVLQGERARPAVAISEPGGGSDAMSMRTTAIRKGDVFVTNGEKTWITYAESADFCILFARTPNERDGGVTCFLVDREMGWTSSPIAMMGSRDKIGSLVFEDVEIPAENVMGEVNRGFDHMMGFIYRNRAFVLSAKNLGAAERLLEMAIDWVKDRVVMGSTLAKRDSVQFTLAECEIQLRAAKLLVYQAADKARRGEDYRHEAYVNKVYVARMANDVVDKVLQLHGALGYSKESPIERWYRDLRVERIYDGADEVNLANIARNLLRGHMKPGHVLD